MHLDPNVERIINETIEPLQKDIKKLKENVQQLSDAQEDDRESLIRDLLKRSPLYTRFKVFLEMQHLDLMIQPDRQATDQEWQQAHEWANKTTVYLIQSLLRWEKDGRPALYPKRVKKDLENTEE